MNNFEILAPAGDMLALKAAISAGANAIYLGGEKFSARAKAKNFSVEEIKEAVKYAHLRKVKIYVTVNILIDNGEIDEAIEFVKELYLSGVDALILQDIGFANLVKKTIPNFEIHASTQMAINNLYGALFLESIGFSRVVLARETPLYEIEKIREKTNLEIEVFIHGALCVSYSGECLMSSMIGAKSGNRGECRGPCRKSYEIISKDGKKFNRAYYLSPRDLNSLDTVIDMIGHGAYSLKIEGRMKSENYVYYVVKAYRDAIEKSISKIEKENVKALFNRRFTKGLFYGDFGKNFVSTDRPDNRGIEVGEILSKNKDSYEIKFFQDIDAKDGLEFESIKGRFGKIAKEDYKKNIIYKIRFRENLKVQSKINRTYYEELNKLINENLNNNYYYRDLNLYASFKIHEKPYLIASSSNFEVKISGENLVEPSINNPTSKEKVIENLSKLNDTVFELKNIEVDLENKSYIKISDINKLRRDAIGKLENIILRQNRNKEDFKNIDYKLKKRKKEKNDYNIVKIEDISDIKSIDLNLVDKFIIKYRDLDKIDLNSLQKDFYVELDLIYDYIELEEVYKNIREKNIKNIILNNLSQVYMFKDLNINKVVGIGINSFNFLTLNFLENFGITGAILSPELTLKDIRKISKNTNLNLMVISYGRIVVMTMEHCIFSAVKGCIDIKNCSTCKYKNYFIRDEKNVDFEVKRDRLSEVYNSYPIYLEEELEKLEELNISRVIISDKFLNDILKIYNGSKDKFIKEKLKKEYGSITKGHFNRGVISG